MRHKNIIDGIGLLFLAVMLFWVPHHLQQPGFAHHKILVAAETLHDGVFDRTVILILKQNGFGAFGLVVNKPPFGGPVGKNLYYTLQPDFNYTVSPEAPKKTAGAQVFQGAASWTIAQLPGEIGRGGWRVIEYNHGLIYKTDPAKMWERAIKMPPATRPGIF